MQMQMQMSPEELGEGGTAGGGVVSSSSSFAAFESDMDYLASISPSAGFLALYSELVRVTLEHVLLASNAPCMLMSHDGVDLCALVVGCLRRLQRWSYTSLLDEFTRHTTALQLREEGGRGGHKGRTGGGGAEGRAGPTSSPSSSSSSLHPLHYASNGILSADLERLHRFEELLELFDPAIVRLPPDATAKSRRRNKGDMQQQQQQQPPSQPLCVDWFRKQKAAERRERRAQQKHRLQRQLDAAIAPPPSAVPATTDASVPSATSCVPSVRAQPQELSLTCWSSDLLSTYRSNRLISQGVRFDAKASLVEEDED
jgi:hypothetical protein